jgi:hypothetical protein
MSLELKVGRLMSLAFHGTKITSAGSLPAVLPGMFSISAGMRDFA